MMMLGTVLFFSLIAVILVVMLVLFLVRGMDTRTQPRAAFPTGSKPQEPGRSSSIAEARSCSHCGAGLQPDWSHCPNCGAPIH